MAAAGATISSCFSTATTTTTSTKTSCIINSKKSDFLLRIACKKLTLQGISHKWRRSRENFKIFATVEQEEVSSAAAVIETENIEEVVSNAVIETENIEEVVNEEKEVVSNAVIETENIEEEEVVNEEKEVVSNEEVVREDQTAAAATATAAAAAAAATTTATKLYFGNLPYSCDSAQLAGVVQEYGSPEMVEVLYDKTTGRSRGFAFVTMSSVEDAEAVIKSLEGSEYGGRTMRVNFADKPKPKEPLYPESDFKLFVGNLSWNTTSECLIEMFRECGNVVGARVLYDGETGRSRGYGFVCYSTKEEMDIALESLNGVELDGREMRVSPAQGRRN